jgi:AcrR family transcriptional regulator
MPRWEPNAPERLERAALELFAEQGFEQTTVPEIATRAGMTTRSFFRHYADKRAVLFRGEDDLPQRIAGMLRDAPDSLTVMEMLIWGIETMAKNFFEGQREAIRLRGAIVATDVGLQERELRKQAEIASAICEALVSIGHDRLEATVAGKLATAISSTALARWATATDARPVTDHVREVAAAITGLVTDGSARLQVTAPG